ncbi:MAG: TIGR03067 domain-containing protein [Planctomycetaceae bacterium]|nr:TIGR03067 domain-containing protein [Planctomycetaceae bacterium]
MRLLNILLLVTLVGIAGCESREEARRKHVVNNLKQLGLALHANNATNPEPTDTGESAPSDETSTKASENVATAVDAKDEAIKKDRKLIEGTWRVIAVEIDGNKLEGEAARKFSVVNGNDGTWSLRSDGNEVSKGPSTIDPTMKPKTIDFTPSEGEGKGELHLGIYELGEKTRKLCIAPPGKGRPAEFTSPAGSEFNLVTFEREKAK